MDSYMRDHDYIYYLYDSHLGWVCQEQPSKVGLRRIRRDGCSEEGQFLTGRRRSGNDMGRIPGEVSILPAFSTNTS